MSTKIEWAQESWNPVTGCSAVGAGCLHCYARTMSLRLKAMGNPKYRNGFEVTCHPEVIDQPLHWRKPRRIFICSMSDLFHPEVPRRFINQVLGTTLYTRQHTYIILTKRVARMCLHINSWQPMELPNIWLGVSVSTQREANELIPILRECPAATRIVSYEPALAAIDWRPIIKGVGPFNTLRDINWLICGAESGPGRRPFDEDWARAARDACQLVSVPFFYKQGRNEKNKVVHRPYLDGRRYEEYPCQ